ncbi:hypothetical protein KDK95_06520 [Actinospica sp. MGRD01-02]|uniref:Amidohydrolase-related domain-containing protein n=1 Tax=Actinospica acidithermotolerans TaxID=2828514 RepID=A0A941E9C5_9ACTN|nr:hypothetical protein [Actinospica acidithermotolerans]MBR7825955.1 hypothetical protein [Actinospica acidithermotolerans]
MSTFAVTNVRVFDGETVLDADTVRCTDGAIVSVGHGAPAGVELIDGCGGMLLPGLIDAHVHPTDDGLRQALSFGVTTVFEMGGPPRSPEDRARIAADDDLADILSAGLPLTAVCGHPNELFVSREELFEPEVPAVLRRRRSPAWPIPRTCRDSSPVRSTQVPTSSSCSPRRAACLPRPAFPS